MATGSAPSLKKTLLLFNSCHNLSQKSKCWCFALWNCAASIQRSLNNLCLDVWCGHTAVYNSIDLSPESKKYASSVLEPFALFELLFPHLAIICILFPRVFCPIALVFPPPVVSVVNVHECILARPAVHGREIQKSRQACGSQLSLSRDQRQFGV